MGDELLPPNRPLVATVFIPETQQMKQDTLELQRAIVVDAKLKLTHTPEMIQSALMSATRSDYPFALTHMTGTQYLLVLSLGTDRNQFLSRFSKPLQDMGYVAYPWSRAVNGFPLQLKYRIWIELHKITPQAWSIDYLIPAISSFGIVLDHGSMTRVGSLDKMTVVVAVADLEKIPHAIEMWIRNISRVIGVVVRGWVEDPQPMTHIVDPTPSQNYFDQVRLTNLQAVTGYDLGVAENGGIGEDFLFLLSVWENLEEGDRKEKMGNILRKNPQFTILLEHNRNTAGGDNQRGHRVSTGRDKGPLLEGSSSRRIGEIHQHTNSQRELNAVRALANLNTPSPTLSIQNTAPVGPSFQTQLPPKQQDLNEKPLDWASEPLTQMSAAQIAEREFLMNDPPTEGMADNGLTVDQAQAAQGVIAQALGLDLSPTGVIIEGIPILHTDEANEQGSQTDNIADPTPYGEDTNRLGLEEGEIENQENQELEEGYEEEPEEVLEEDEEALREVEEEAYNQHAYSGDYVQPSLDGSESSTE